MAVPSSNIRLANDVYAEANGGYSSGQVELFELGFQSYFNGPNGDNTIAYNAWGRGVGSGANRIYGTTATSTNINLNGFAGLTYFYDNSTFQVTLNITNNLITNLPPNPPPFADNTIAVTLELYDSTITYNYLQTVSGNVNGPGNTGDIVASSTSDPIIFRGYWKVLIGGTDPTFAGGSCNISINGTAKVTGGTLNAGPGQTTFDSATSGTADVANYLGLTGLYFEVTVN